METVPTDSVPAHPPTRRTLDGERLMTVFSEIVEPIGRALPASSEVVLHDLSLLPNSIIAVYGSVTDRRVGDPATDLLLEQSVAGFPEHHLGYETMLQDGRRMRSSTMIIRDVAGNPVAALCINTDVSAWTRIRDIADAMIDGAVAGSASSRAVEAPAAPSLPAQNELFVKDVDELASHLIHQSLQSVGLPVSKMKKDHKMAVVRTLKSRGIFTLRESVSMVADALGVTRFTIYNYLNELGDETKPAAAGATEVAEQPVPDPIESSHSKETK